MSDLEGWIYLCGILLNFFLIVCFMSEPVINPTKDRRIELSLLFLVCGFMPYINAISGVLGICWLFLKKDPYEHLDL